MLDELQIRQAEVTRLSENAREMFQLKLQDAARIQDFAFQVYGIQRADEIRQEDLALREQDYIREIERNDFEYNRALQDGRALDAERFLRDREVLEEERGYNEALAIDNALIQVGIDPGVQSKEEKMQALARFNNQQIEFEKSLQTAK